MLFDIESFIASSLMVLLYYLNLARQSRSRPESRVHALNARIRARWAYRMMCHEKLDILAVQTLRNSLMAANFMATTSILLIIGVLNLSGNIGVWVQSSHLSWLANSASADLWQLKIALLAINYAVAFYYFSMSIRFFNHVGYMISLGCDMKTEKSLFKNTCAYLNRAGSHYMLGTRTFFLSLPIIMWFFGPIFLIPATSLLIVGLALLDRVPECELTEADLIYVKGQPDED